MRIVETIDLVSAGGLSRTPHWRRAWRNVKTAIRSTDWPHGSGLFTLFPGRHANGVKPIKTPCLEALRRQGWETESLPEIRDGALTTGDLDAILETKSGYIGFEWETGNISSSHRAINKLVLALIEEVIVGGFLVVPSAKLYNFLTDRVGNVEELRPYFALWKAMDLKRGCLRIVVVEHDKTSTKVRRIPKGTDGRATR